MAQYISNTIPPKKPLNMDVFKTQKSGLMSVNPVIGPSKPVTWGLNTPSLNQMSTLGNMQTKTTTPMYQNTQGMNYQAPPPSYFPKQTSTPQTPQNAPQTPSGGTSPKMPMGGGFGSGTQPTQNSQQDVLPVKGILPVPQNKFGGLVDDLRNKSNPSNTQTGLVGDIKNASGKNTQIGEDARAIAQKYADEIARVGQLGAGAVAGNLSTGTNVVGSGNAAIASQSASQRMSALSQGLVSELQGTQQQLTAQDQLVNALNMALGGTNVQQQQQLSGLSSATGFAQPSPAGYGQTVFDPLTGQYTGGSQGLDPNGVASQLAQAVRSGQMTYEQAVQSLGYAGGAGQQFLNNALGPGFNPTLATATMSGQAGVLGQLPAMESADVAAEGIKSKITTYLASNPQLNPTDLAVGNTLTQWIQGKQLTDPKYQTLFNYLNEYTSTLAPILGVGGDTTNLKTQIAQSFINAAASGQSIAEVLDNMQSLSRGKLQDIRSGATGGGVVSSPVTGSGTGSGGLFDW